MCFHMKQTSEAQKLKKRFNAEVQAGFAVTPTEHFNGFVHPETPVICGDSPGVIRGASWGLVPVWAKDKSIQKHTVNARIETVREKPSFRGAVENRCLIIADGFYEWQWLTASGSRKQKHLIQHAKQEVFCMGGIWEDWVDKATGEITRSYAMVTTAANELMSVVHNTKKRMPVILSEADEAAWLDGMNIDEFAYPRYNCTLKNIPLL